MILPDPGEGNEWVRLPTTKVNNLRREWPAKGTRSAHRYPESAWVDLARSLGELNPPPAPTIEPGMWVKVGSDIRYIHSQLHSENGRPWFVAYRMWPCDEDQQQSIEPVIVQSEDYRPCDPPEWADELYELLGIDTP